MEWKRFKRVTERKWQECYICPHCSGYQTQSGTLWNTGLSFREISAFEASLGFRLPRHYKEMLSVINGFDRDSIDVQGSDKKEPIYDRRCYKYADDIEKVQWLLDDLGEFKEYLYQVLSTAGFNCADITGYMLIELWWCLVIINYLLWCRLWGTI